MGRRRMLTAKKLTARILTARILTDKGSAFQFRECVHACMHLCSYAAMHVCSYAYMYVRAYVLNALAGEWGGGKLRNIP